MIKVLRSIISPEFILEKVKKDYNLGMSLSCQLLKACGSNDIYEINGDQRYILKLYSIRKCWPYTYDHYLFELEFQKFLYENNVSVPNPIKNKYGSLISEFNTLEYRKYYALYTYLNGTLINYKKTCDKKLFLFGQNLANMHNIAKEFKPSTIYKRTVDLDFLIKKSQESISKYANIKSLKILKKFNDVAYKLEKKAKLIDLNDLNFGLIHGDMHIINYFYDKKVKTISFFDFELCGYGYYIYDLAVFKWGLLIFSAHRKKFVHKLFQHVINGYLSVDNSLEPSLKYIDLFVALRNFFVIGSGFLLYPETPQHNNESTINKFLQEIGKYLVKNKT